MNWINIDLSIRIHTLGLTLHMAKYSVKSILSLAVFLPCHIDFPYQIYLIIFLYIYSAPCFIECIFNHPIAPDREKMLLDYV